MTTNSTKNSGGNLSHLSSRVTSLIGNGLSCLEIRFSCLPYLAAGVLQASIAFIILYVYVSPIFCSGFVVIFMAFFAKLAWHTLQDKYR